MEGKWITDQLVSYKKYLNNILYTWGYMFLSWQNFKNRFEFKFIFDHFLAVLCEYICSVGFSDISSRYQKQGIGN